MGTDLPSRISLSPKAEADLEDVWIYTAERWSSHQADRYIESLAATFDMLLAMPLIARERKELSQPVRLHPTGSHLILYSIEGRDLLIIRILGGRQDWQVLLEALDP
ncbi:type II toxin-antitoxin system RelE/ParE family toxin [Cereibacter changlensis]|uniref:type II toxin-antitoxin system RelE/ParE family toxin n=1 Tax=Cereibacter changlensis TaxID=402884 RepID=UPI00200AB47C|nr:type II toxin-antitoxin system RelE/ParE family toxin [Cereibacter changlensis]